MPDLRHQPNRRASGPDFQRELEPPFPERHSDGPKRWWFPLKWVELKIPFTSRCFSSVLVVSSHVIRVVSTPMASLDFLSNERPCCNEYSRPDSPVKSYLIHFEVNPTLLHIIFYQLFEIKRNFNFFKDRQNSIYTSLFMELEAPDEINLIKIVLSSN